MCDLPFVFRLLVRLPVVNGWQNRLNRKRVKHRLEFDSGGRKWINLDDEQVRATFSPRKAGG